MPLHQHFYNFVMVDPQGFMTSMQHFTFGSGLNYPIQCVYLVCSKISKIIRKVINNFRLVLKHKHTIPKKTSVGHVYLFRNNNVGGYFIFLLLMSYN